MIQTVSFIGSGNVATHLASALSDFVEIIQIFSRNEGSAKALAKAVNAEPCLQFADLQPCDLILVCVPDDAIVDVFNSLENTDSLIAHTSGITGLNLPSTRVGYFYPLQTFRKKMETDLANTPIFIDANTSNDQNSLRELAEKISDRVLIVDHHEKEKLHLSAVFINNYVNHLFGLTEEFLRAEQLDFTLLEPIIRTTIDRALSERAIDIQTGPALRRDQTTISKHLALLGEYRELKNMYKYFVQSIQSVHQ